MDRSYPSNWENFFFGPVFMFLPRILETLAVSVVYLVTARLSQIFAMEPGNISPVWIPSGIMLCWVMLRGKYLLAGVFFGAFAGNSWAYLDVSSLSAALPGLFAGLMNGLGDALAIQFSIVLLTRFVPDLNFFRRSDAFLAFFLSCVVLGPMTSAIFGTGSLWLAGIMADGQFMTALMTWFLGDSVGVLLLAPSILVIYFGPTLQKRSAPLIE